MNDFDFNLGDMTGSASGLDAFFNEEPSIVTPLAPQSSPLQAPKVASEPAPTKRVKVASLSDLGGFVRIAEDQLINKSTQDLWSLRKSDDGDFYIERMFEDGQPLRG